MKTVYPPQLNVAWLAFRFRLLTQIVDYIGTLEEIGIKQCTILIITRWLVVEILKSSCHSDSQTKYCGTDPGMYITISILIIYISKFIEKIIY